MPPQFSPRRRKPHGSGQRQVIEVVPLSIVAVESILIVCVCVPLGKIPSVSALRPLYCIVVAALEPSCVKGCKENNEDVGAMKEPVYVLSIMVEAHPPSNDPEGVEGEPEAVVIGKGPSVTVILCPKPMPLPDSVSVVLMR